ncbi:MAG TPA: hypothetical protein VFO01_11635 [Trebonia sp.]|nr:hypothetical protein [Trebonia sp.]
MNPIGKVLTAAVSLAAVASLAVTACSAPANPAPAHRTEQQAAVLNWLARTNAMWTRNDFAALDEITTAEMRTIYLAERRQASLPSNASRQPFQLTGLSITIPCQGSRPAVFVAYGDTDVFDLGPAMQPMAMVFERVDGRWKLAAAVNRPPRGWPALCTEGKPPSVPPALAAADYAPELARVLTHATIGSAETAGTAAPFAVNDFFAGSGSINAQAARQAGQNRRAGVSFTQGFSTTANPTLALPLAGGRGFWMVGFLTQTGRYASAAGLRAKNWPDGNQVATPRPAVVHHETDTFITTYTAIDPPRSAGATLTLDGFFGWPLSAVAS